MLQLKHRLHASGFPRSRFRGLLFGGRICWLNLPDFAFEQGAGFKGVDGHGDGRHFFQFFV